MRNKHRYPLSVPLIRLFVVALVGAALTACGGGGGNGNGDEEEIQTQFNIVSTPDLDGVVFGDNLSTEGRSDLSPAVGDAPFVAEFGASRFVGYWSFDLSDIPAGAIVKTATLSLFNQELRGDPQGMMVLARIDHVAYGANFPQEVLGAQGLDFNFATINDMGTTGRKNVDVKAQLQADVDAGRDTSQYRLRGAIATNFDNVTDLALLTDGEDSAGSGELPLLIVEIEQP